MNWLVGSQLVPLMRTQWRNFYDWKVSLFVCIEISEICSLPFFQARFRIDSLRNFFPHSIFWDFRKFGFLPGIFFIINGPCFLNFNNSSSFLDLHSLHFVLSLSLFEILSGTCSQSYWLPSFLSWKELKEIKLFLIPFIHSIFTKKESRMERVKKKVEREKWWKRRYRIH